MFHRIGESAGLFFFTSTLMAMPVPFIPTEETTCRYLFNDITPCAFKNIPKDSALKYARGIRINFQNNNACLMRMTTTNASLLLDKPLRRVTRYSERNLYHIWWLETDNPQLFDLECANALTDSSLRNNNPSFVFNGDGRDELDATGWEYPQSYCLKAEDNQQISLGLTDKTNPDICQTFDSQLQGVYGNTLQRVFIDTRPQPYRRFRRSDTVTDVNAQPSKPSSDIPVGFTWSDLGTKLLIFCVVASVFPTMVMTAHTKCCSRR